MIPIKETIEVDAPPEQVWPVLSDPALVVTCVPGASLGVDKGNGTYEGSIAVSFGPVKAVFRGIADLAYDHAARSCTIAGRGQDQRGASRANAKAVISISGTNTTTIAVDGGFDVSGPLAQFARTGGVHVARELLAQFASNLSAKLRQADTSAAPTTSAPASPQAVGGFTLLWRALLAWLRSLTHRSHGAQ